MAGVRKGSGMDVLLRGYVFGEAAKLVPDEDTQVISMPSGNMGPSLESMVVDAAFMWEPFISQFLLRGNTQVIFDMNEAEPKYPWYIISAMPEAMEERPDAIVAALRAHKKAVDFLNSSDDAGNDVIAAAFKLDDVTGPDGTVYPATEVVRQARARLGWEWSLNDNDVAFIQRLMNWSLELGYIKRQLTTDELIDRSFAAKAAEG